MENERMVELFGIDAIPIGEKRYPSGTEVHVFSSGDKLVAKVDGEVVASFSKSYAKDLKAEKEKHVVLGTRIGDSVRLSVRVPALRAVMASAHDSMMGSNGSFRIDGDKIIYNGSEAEGDQVRLIVNASARVESGEDLKQRVTATRLFFLGVFAFAFKKSTGGEKFLTIEGDDFFWAVEIPNESANQAMRFAAKVNSIAKALKMATAKPIKGLATPDGKVHTAVVSVSGGVFCKEDGVNAGLSERLDAKLMEIADAGRDVLSVAPLACGEDAMSVLVTYK